MFYLNSVNLVATKVCFQFQLVKPSRCICSHFNELYFRESQISSRLAQELREKNALVYGFGSGLQLDRDTNVGALSISANYTSGRSAQVSASIHKVLNDLVKMG